MPSHHVPTKIPKYDGRCDLVKHLNSYKTHVSLMRALVVKYRAFYFTLEYLLGALEVGQNLKAHS